MGGKPANTKRPSRDQVLADLGRSDGAPVIDDSSAPSHVVGEHTGHDDLVKISAAEERSTKPQAPWQVRGNVKKYQKRQLEADASF